MRDTCLNDARFGYASYRKQSLIIVSLIRYELRVRPRRLWQLPPRSDLFQEQNVNWFNVRDSDYLCDGGESYVARWFGNGVFIHSDE